LKWLLDTNVISESVRARPSPDVMRWVAAQPVDSLFTVPLVIAEISVGIARLPETPKKSALEHWFEERVRPLFGPRILEPDQEFWTTLLHLHRRLKAQQRTLPVEDLILATAAEHHGLVMVTRNVRDFEGSGIQVLDPWEASPVVRTCR
jgi:toxin FitB